MEDEDTGLDRLEVARNLLLAVLIVAEGAYLWTIYKDSPAGLVFRSKCQARLAKLTGRCPKCQQYRQDRAQMHWRAYLHTQGKDLASDGTVVDIPNE